MDINVYQAHELMTIDVFDLCVSGFACECVWKESEVDLCSFAHGARGCVRKAGMSAFRMSC